MSTPDLTSDVIAEIQARYEKREMLMEAGKVDDVGFEFDLPQLHSDIAALLSLAKRAGEMEWRPIETAPKDGTVFIALVSGLPYAAKYDQHGRFVWYWHADMASGPCYTIHDCDGKRHLEEYTAREAPRYAPSGHLWVNGFAENPTHWLPLPPPPATQEQGG